jgi:hypothetical protein
LGRKRSWKPIPQFLSLAITTISEIKTANKAAGGSFGEPPAQNPE